MWGNMTAYINELIITVVVCQIASMISPETENSKRYIKTVCALVTILTLISPVRTIINHAEEIANSLKNFFAMEETVEENSVRDTMQSVAYTIMKYTEENYELEIEGAEVSFITDESGQARELQIFLKSGNVEDRDKLKAELERELGIIVHIFIESS